MCIVHWLDRKYIGYFHYKLRIHLVAKFEKEIQNIPNNVHRVDKKNLQTEQSDRRRLYCPEPLRTLRQKFKGKHVVLCGQQNMLR